MHYYIEAIFLPLIVASSHPISLLLSSNLYYMLTTKKAAKKRSVSIFIYSDHDEINLLTNDIYTTFPSFSQHKKKKILRRNFLIIGKLDLSVNCRYVDRFILSSLRNWKTLYFETDKKMKMKI